MKQAMVAQTFIQSQWRLGRLEDQYEPSVFEVSLASLNEMPSSKSKKTCQWT